MRQFEVSSFSFFKIRERTFTSSFIGKETPSVLTLAIVDSETKPNVIFILLV